MGQVILVGEITFLYKSNNFVRFIYGEMLSNLPGKASGCDEDFVKCK